MAQMEPELAPLKWTTRLSMPGVTCFGDGVSAEQMQWIKIVWPTPFEMGNDQYVQYRADFSALNSRIFGTVEYYTSQTNNLLFNINIPQMNGLDKIPSNIGKMSNKGFEMTVTGIPIETKRFLLGCHIQLLP